MVQRKLQRAKQTKPVPASAPVDESQLHGKYVARDRQGRVLIHAATCDALVKAIRKQKLGPADFRIEHIRPRNVMLIF